MPLRATPIEQERLDLVDQQDGPFPLRRAEGRRDIPLVVADKCREDVGRPLNVQWHLDAVGQPSRVSRSEEHTSELQSLMRISYAVFCLKKKKENKQGRT